MVGESFDDNQNRPRRLVDLREALSHFREATQQKSAVMIRLSVTKAKGAVRDLLQNGQGDYLDATDLRDLQTIEEQYSDVPAEASQQEGPLQLCMEMEEELERAA